MRFALGFLCALIALLLPALSLADVRVDRSVVRFSATEVGGVLRPQWITERTLAFEVRLESLADPDISSELRVRSAIEHHVAQTMLAALVSDAEVVAWAGPHLSDEWVSLLERFGGPANVEQAYRREGLSIDEAYAILWRQLRAGFAVRKITAQAAPPTDSQLRELHRSGPQPYRALAFDRARPKLLRWFLIERARLLEIAYLQTARSRVKIVAAVGGG